MLININNLRGKFHDSPWKHFRKLDNRHYLYLMGDYFLRKNRITQCNYMAVQDLILKCYKDSELSKLTHYIDGAYTIILYDNEMGSLTALTDPYGLNKLYYLLNGDSLLISDNIKSILHNCNKIAINLRGLCEFLRFLDISPPQTIYENVFVLEPNKVITFSRLGNQINKKELNLEVDICSSDSTSLEDYISDLEVALFDSFYDRITNSKKVGLLLSGGIDSSLLAVVLSKILDETSVLSAIAYTVGFKSPKLDESKIACGVAKHLGIEHKMLRFDLYDELKVFREITGKIEIPFADPATISTVLCLKRMKEDNVDTAIEGTGADGLIGYMPSRYHNLVVNFSSRIPFFLRSRIASCLRAMGDTFRLLPLFDFKDPQEKFIRWRGWSKDEIESLCGIQCSFISTAFYRKFEDHKNKGIYELYRQLLMSMPDDRITESLKIYGLRPCFPFWDSRVKSLLQKVPFEYKYFNGQNKYLYKKLLGKYVPEDIWNVPKHGFDYPFEKLLQYRSNELIKNYLSFSSLKNYGFFDPQVVDDYVRRFMNGDLSVRFKIWGLIVFQAWYENYFLNL